MLKQIGIACLFFICGCAQIGPNTYGFSFDPRAQQYKDEQALLAREKIDRINKEILENKRAEEQHQRDKEADEMQRMHDEQQALQAQKEREEQEEQRRQQFQQRQDQIAKSLKEQEDCNDYVKSHCKYKIECHVVRKCKTFGSDVVCQDNKECSETDKLSCKGTPPNNCSVN